VPGPIVIDLDADDEVGPDASGFSEISAELAADITSDPGAYYVNLHNAGFQAGAIRGQLKRPTSCSRWAVSPRKGSATYR
jgi:hypothetical protein